MSDHTAHDEIEDLRAIITDLSSPDHQIADYAAEELTRRGFASHLEARLRIGELKRALH